MGTTLFAPFADDGTTKFDRRRAAHLLRRAGFAPTSLEVDRAVELGLEATVDDLFVEDSEQEAGYAGMFAAVAGKLMNLATLEGAQAWWLYRMLTTSTPLREKLALFWHGHFATSQLKVENTELMLRQIDLLRDNGMRGFEHLVLAISAIPPCSFGSMENQTRASIPMKTSLAS